jgi:hypothetical protein
MDLSSNCAWGFLRLDAEGKRWKGGWVRLCEFDRRITQQPRPPELPSQFWRLLGQYLRICPEIRWLIRIRWWLGQEEKVERTPIELGHRPGLRKRGALLSAFPRLNLGGPDVKAFARFWR